MKQLLAFAVATMLLVGCKKEECGNCIKTVHISVTPGMAGYPTTTQDTLGIFCGDELLKKNGKTNMTVSNITAYPRKWVERDTTRCH